MLNRFIKSLVLTLGAVSLVGCSSPARGTLDARPTAKDSAPALKKGPRVVLVSVDGMLPGTYLEPDTFALSVPTLRTLRAEGAYSEGMVTVYPSVTYPAHTSMATGVLPSTHGIGSNRTPDPLARNQQGWYWYAEDIRVPTLWSVAREQGLSTALINWPVTVGASADALLPEYWRAGTKDDVKLARAMSTPGLLDAVAERFPDFYDNFTPPDVRDQASIDVAIHLIESSSPDLLMVHTWMVDEFQHQTGPWGTQAKVMIEEADAQLKRLIDALKSSDRWEDTILVIASDHGFLAYDTVILPGVLLAQNGLVTLDGSSVTASRASADGNGGMAYIYITDENDAEAKQLVTTLFTNLAAQPDSGIGRVFTREEIIAKGGDSKAFLALDAADGYALGHGYTGEARLSRPGRGSHGWDPALPAMNASLLVYGPRVVPGVINNARIIDLAPTIASWLDLPFTHAEGQVLGISLSERAGAAQ